MTIMYLSPSPRYTIVSSTYRKKPTKKSIARNQRPRTTTLFGVVALALVLLSLSNNGQTTAASSTTDALYQKGKSDEMRTTPFLTHHLVHDTSPSTLATPMSADHEGVSGDGMTRGHANLKTAFSPRLVQDTFSSSTTSSDTINRDEKKEGGVVKDSIGDDHYSMSRKVSFE